MGRPKRQILATYEETANPPGVLPPDHHITRVVKAEGNNLFKVERSNRSQLLVELPAQFRSAFWVKRGGFVVVDLSAFEDRNNKLDGEITTVIREEKLWRKQAYWPTEFPARSQEDSSDEEEESRMGKLPPSYSDEEM